MVPQKFCVNDFLYNRPQNLYIQFDILSYLPNLTLLFRRSCERAVDLQLYVCVVLVLDS